MISNFNTPKNNKKRQRNGSNAVLYAGSIFGKVSGMFAAIPISPIVYNPASFANKI